MGGLRNVFKYSVGAVLLLVGFSSGPPRTMGYRWCVHPVINCAFKSQQDCTAAATRSGGWCELTLTVESDPARTGRPRR